MNRVFLALFLFAFPFFSEAKYRAVDDFLEQGHELVRNLELTQARLNEAIWLIDGEQENIFERLEPALSEASETLTDLVDAIIKTPRTDRASSIEAVAKGAERRLIALSKNARTYSRAKLASVTKNIFFSVVDITGYLALALTDSVGRTVPRSIAPEIRALFLALVKCFHQGEQRLREHGPRGDRYVNYLTGTTFGMSAREAGSGAVPLTGERAHQQELSLLSELQEELAAMGGEGARKLARDLFNLPCSHPVTDSSPASAHSDSEPVG